MEGINAVPVLVSIDRADPRPGTARAAVYVRLNELIGQPQDVVLQAVEQAEKGWHKLHGRVVSGRRPAGWLKLFGAVFK